MALIESQVEIDAAPNKVWELVSDMDNEPRFWKGIKEVRNISKTENTIEREVVIAFREQKCLQTVTLTPKEKIEVVFTKGIIDGSKVITVAPDDEKTVLGVVWEIKLTGMMGMFTGMIKKHIKSGTEQALQGIKRELEQ